MVVLTILWEKGFINNMFLINKKKIISGVQYKLDMLLGK